MSKHTEGPWETLKTKQIPGVTVASGWAISPVRGRKPILDIAQVHLSASQDEATQAANAALIAAAPDLLAACEYALKFFEDEREDRYPIISVLRKAIKKSKGGA